MGASRKILAALGTTVVWLVSVMLLVQTTPARAELIRYTFTGAVDSGVLDLGAGPVDLTGSSFAATGTIVNEDPVSISADPSLETGRGFLGTTVYDFGVLGAFATDVGADVYFQQPYRFGPLKTRLCLYDNVATIRGFCGVSSQDIAFADVDVPQAIGLIVFDVGSGGSVRTITNADGHSLTFVGTPIFQAEIVALAIPEPQTLLLFAIGCFLLIGSRTKVARRKFEPNSR